MRGAHILRTCLTATGIALLGASWTSCSSGSKGSKGAAGGDASDDGNANGDSTIQDEPACDPCNEACPCTFMDTFFNTGKCATVTCTATTNGMWGGANFCGGPGCPDTGDDGGSVCDPCVSACACELGFPPRSDPSTCRVVACKGTGSPTLGTWGPGVFCPTTRVCDGGVDAANESGADVIPEAASD